MLHALSALAKNDIYSRYGKYDFILILDSLICADVIKKAVV